MRIGMQRRAPLCTVVCGACGEEGCGRVRGEVGRQFGSVEVGVRLLPPGAVNRSQLALAQPFHFPVRDQRRQMQASAMLPTVTAATSLLYYTYAAFDEQREPWASRARRSTT
jgi:hypothetical protein